MLLDINPALLGSNKNVGLQVHWQKYLAIKEAIQKMQNMVQTGTWTGRAPVQRNIIDLFISHSYYLATHRKLFPKVNAYPELRRWMNGDPDRPKRREGKDKGETKEPEVSCIIS